MEGERESLECGGGDLVVAPVGLDAVTFVDLAVALRQSCNLRPPAQPRQPTR